MNKADLMEMALEKLVGDMDDLEGAASMAHDAEECPDPLGCTMHDSEHGENLAGDGKGGVEIEIKKIGGGLPSMAGGGEMEKEAAAEDGLSAEEAEELKKLLSK